MRMPALDFNWLSANSNVPTVLLGIFPPLKNIAVLFAVSCAVAMGPWLWSTLLAGGLATATPFLPFLGYSIVGVLAFTVLNFMFRREVIAAKKSVREFAAKLYDDDNPVDVVRLMNSVTAEVNAHFEMQDPENYQYMPPPLFGYFTSHDAKIITIEGRNYGNSALYFSSGMFHSHETKLNQHHLAALIRMELVKIYKRREVSSTFVAMVKDLLSTIEIANYFSPTLIWLLSSPLAVMLKFLEIFPSTVYRSYEIEAAIEVAKMGFGEDLIQAIYKRNNPSEILNQRRLPAKDAREKASVQRADYTGLMEEWIRPISHWVDRHQWKTADKTGWRILVLPAILIREVLTFLNELHDKIPRSTTILKSLYEQTKGQIDENGALISYGEVLSKKALPLFRRTQEALRLKLHDWISNKPDYVIQLLQEKPEDTDIQEYNIYLYAENDVVNYVLLDRDKEVVRESISQAIGNEKYTSLQEAINSQSIDRITDKAKNKLFEILTSRGRIYPRAEDVMYAPIGPDGNGYATPLHVHHHHHDLARVYTPAQDRHEYLNQQSQESQEKQVYELEQDERQRLELQ